MNWRMLKKLKEMNHWMYYRCKEMEEIALNCACNYDFDLDDKDNLNFEDWAWGSFAGRLADEIVFVIIRESDKELELQGEIGIEFGS